MTCPKCNSQLFKGLSLEACTNKACDYEKVYAFNDPKSNNNPYIEYDGKGVPVRNTFNGKY